MKSEKEITNTKELIKTKDPSEIITQSEKDILSNLIKEINILCLEMYTREEKEI